MFEPRSYQILSDNGQKYHFRSQLVLDEGIRTPRVYDSLRIVYIESGNFTWRIDGRTYVVHAGDFVLLNPMEYRFQYDFSTDMPLIQQVVEFSPAFAYPCLKCLEPFYNRNSAVSGNVITPEAPGYSDILDCFRKLACETFAPSDFRDEAIRGAFLSLISSIAKKCPADGTPKARSVDCSPAGFGIVCDTIRYIRAHLSQELSVSSLARRAGLSPAHFSRLFTSVWGISVTTYIRQQRIQAVLEMLNERDVNVLDAALECGFRSSSGFYKAARDVLGTPPRRTGQDART